MNVLATVHPGMGRYAMIVSMINYLRARMENLIDWAADSLIDFDLDDELFDEEEL